MFYWLTFYIQPLKSQQNGHFRLFCWVYPSSPAHSPQWLQTLPSPARASRTRSLIPPFSGKEPFIAARQQEPFHCIPVLQLPFPCAQRKFTGKLFQSQKNPKKKIKVRRPTLKPTLGKMQGQCKYPARYILNVFTNETPMFAGQPCIFSRTAAAWFSFIFSAFFFSFWESYFTKENQTEPFCMPMLISKQGQNPKQLKTY